MKLLSIKTNDNKSADSYKQVRCGQGRIHKGNRGHVLPNPW